MNHRKLNGKLKQTLKEQRIFQLEWDMNQRTQGVLCCTTVNELAIQSFATL